MLPKPNGPAGACGFGVTGVVTFSKYLCVCVCVCVCVCMCVCEYIA